MRRKALRTLLQLIMLGVLFGTAQSAYADAMSSITFTNFSIGNAAGNPITFGTWQGFASGTANFEGAFVSQTASATSGTLFLFATTPFVPNGGTSFARGAGIVEPTNVTATALAQAIPSGCTCSGSGVGQVVLSNTFTITDGTGSVDVSILLNLSTVQTVALDQFDLSATAEYMFTLAVDGTTIFSVENSISSAIPNSFNEIRATQTLFRTITLALNTPHTITLTGTARASAESEIPEPATLFLLGSGLGLLGGVVKKRRRRFSRG